MVWVPKAEFTLATDPVLASEINRPESLTRNAIQTVLDALLSAAIAANPTLAANVTQAAVDAVAEELLNSAIAKGQYVSADEFSVQFRNTDGGLSAPFVRADEARGIFGTRIQHLAGSVPMPALSADVQKRVSRIEVLDASIPFDYVELTEDRRLIWGRRTDGTLVGDYPGRVNPTNTPTGYLAAGDSTTAGADLVNQVADRWTTKIAQYGINVTNSGSSGTRAEEIAARIGAVYPQVTISGGTIPASGAVTITLLDVDMVRTGEIVSAPVTLHLRTGETVPGTIARVGDGTRSFTRAVAGNAITAAGTVDVRGTTLAGLESSRVFLGMGVNNESLIAAGTQTIAQLQGWYSAAIRGQRFHPIVWGMLDRGYAERAGTANGDLIRAMEAWWATTCGTFFYPVRQYLASQQALTDAVRFNASFTPTTDDLTAVGAGTVPPSFRSDTNSVHLNPLGHDLQAWWMARQMRLRGHI